MAKSRKDKEKEAHRRMEIWARERREFLKRERAILECPIAFYRSPYVLPE